MTMSARVAVAALIACIVAAACGGTSSTGNLPSRWYGLEVTGAVTDSTGHPVTGAAVQLLVYPQMPPPTSPTGTCPSNGEVDTVTTTTSGSGTFAVLLTRAVLNVPECLVVTATAPAPGTATASTRFDSITYGDLATRTSAPSDTLRVTLQLR